MAVLGLSGLFSTEVQDYDPASLHGFYHDAAACLVENGRTLAAVEEERLNRDKHTNRFPGLAARACLEVAGLRPENISHIAFFFEEDFTDQDITRVRLSDPRSPLQPARELIYERLAEFLDEDMRDRPLVFTTHHLAHAASVYYDSGFDSALVFVSDGNGERDGISVYEGAGADLCLLRTYARDHSLGHFYSAITKVLGYRNFDEYKVMGLAAFGDPEPYRAMLSALRGPAEDGDYALDVDRLLPALLSAGFRPRRAWEPLEQRHRDLAAAAQELLERITVDLIRHWRERTGQADLCLAGGVAQNTSLNGKLLRLPGLREIFVPPAAHDAGAALGAAMLVDREVNPVDNGNRYSADAYLGLPLRSEGTILERLDLWREFVDIERPEDLEATVASALAEGAVIGWAQGRSEFGPRALGNRSILADPRPAANRDRVNRIIKQREDYRPFAPVVTAPDAERFFDFPPTSADHGHMSFVVPVRREARAVLGATTHVDGTARVQVVRETQNPALWRLLKEFEQRSGVPVLLNTSFNNHAEPIVDSVDDIVATFLTTGLSFLVVGPFVVRRKEHWEQAIRKATVELMPFCELRHHVGRSGESRVIVRTDQPSRATRVSIGVQRLLTAKGRVTDQGLPPARQEELAAEIRELWNDRLIRLIPG